MDSAFRADSMKLAQIVAADSASRADLARRAERSQTTGAYAVLLAPNRGPAPFSRADSTPEAVPGPAADRGVRRVTAQEVADHLRRAKGQVTVAILYGTRCPRTKAMFASFVELAARYRGQPVRVAAFALDDYPEDVPDFLARYAAPFDQLSIVRGKVGELSGALAPLGFFGGPEAIDPATGVTIDMPHVAVLGRDGQVRAQWPAATNIAVIDQEVRAALGR